MIVVVGAGPAGLMAAWRAALAGHEVTVLEAADRVGGMAGSFTVAGVRVDHGSHRLHPSTPPEILGALRDLLGPDLQTRPRNGRIRLEGRWIAFPPRPLDLVRNLPPSLALRAALDAATAPLRTSRGDTFAGVVGARVGPTMARRFYEPYVRKLWGVAPHELDGELARRRVGSRSVAGAARGRNTAFLYPRTGFGTISEALADAAAAAGATVRLGTAVEAIDARVDDRVTVRLAGRAADVDGALLWWTGPLPALAAVLEPAPSADVLARAARLEHRGLALVYLALGSSRYTPFDAHYFPGLDVPVSRLSEPKGYRDNPEDPSTVTVLCAEVPCTPGHEIWRADDGVLGDAVADALVRSGLPAVDPVAVEVRRLPRVYPLYRPGFAWDLSALELAVGQHPRVVPFGRQGLFVPDNTHHVLAMGWAAAACARRDGTFDRETWARARAHFRTHVVDD